MKTPTQCVVFTNGLIYTGTDDAPIPGSVTIKDGLITTITEGAAPLSPADPGTTVIDLNGRLLVPGFQDAHMHPINGGMELLSCDLSPFRTAEQCLEHLAGYAAKNPDLPWITGGGWSMDMFVGGTPTRDLLDSVIPDVPVFIVNRDHHSAWFNTKAAELAGLSSDTPDPKDGRFERDASGIPSGTAHEGAMGVFASVRPEATPDQGYEGLLAAQDYLLSFGITGWQDAAVGNFMGTPDGFEVYRRAVDAGALKARVRGAQWWSRDQGLDQLQTVLQQRERVNKPEYAGRLSFGSIKIMLDGVAESFTAAMHDCYLDHHGHPTENRGLSYFPTKDLASIVAALDSHGFQIHFHALGDRAVTEALDALDYARSQNGPSQNRHHLAHLQVVRATDVVRLAELGAYANLQALWAAHDEQLDALSLPFMRPELEARHYPFGELAAAGAALAAGSDWPVSSPDPIQALHVAVNRQSPREPLAPLGDDSQRLTVKQMIDAYTQGSARVNFMEDHLGLIAPGYYADLAILSADVFSIDPDMIHTVVTEETWIAGERVYQRESAQS